MAEAIAGNRSVWDAMGSLDGIIERASGQVPGWRPGRGGLWWWLVLPLMVLISVFGVFRANPDFYTAWVLPEGYGFLEVTQFVEAFTGFLICAVLVSRPVVRDWPLVRRMLVLFAVACLYIAGEEMSWGQHWFGWGTPQAWSEINRQDETNLHNTNYVFNQLPQLILEIGIAVGGIILPVIQSLMGGFRHWFLQLFVPPLELVPVALLVFAVKSLSSLQKNDIGRDLLLRPSETMEVFYYMFILFYLVVLARRINLLEKLKNRPQAA